MNHLIVPEHVVGFTGPTTPTAGLTAPGLAAPGSSLLATSQLTAVTAGGELNVVPESQRTQTGNCVSAPLAPLPDRPDQGAGRSTSLVVRGCGGWQRRTAGHQPSVSPRRVLFLLGIPVRPTGLSGTTTWPTVTTSVTVGQPGCGPAGAAPRRGAAGSQPTSRQGGKGQAERGCDWFAHGLFKGPWEVVMPDGRSVWGFSLADAPGTVVAGTEAVQ